jgi:hypothetical protein
VARYPDLRECAKFATENYARLDSLESIKPPYPANGTPNWWALRKRYEELLLGRIRKDRGWSNHKSTINEPEAEAAKWAALGNETADRDYCDFARVDTAAPDVRKHWRKDATDALE